MTADLSCHVQKFIVILWLGNKLQQNEICIVNEKSLVKKVPGNGPVSETDKSKSTFVPNLLNNSGITSVFDFVFDFFITIYDYMDVIQARFHRFVYVCMSVCMFCVDSYV